jgi:protein-L-isoaspartate(D-aspartate) O-methyltransferase
MADQAAEFAARRAEMVAAQIESRGIKDARVLSAMRRVPRHLFVPEELRSHAYDDEPLPIGEGQTISQPYIVAYMTEALGLKGNEKVLEIGTGSGYQTAVLAELVPEVYTVELLGGLSSRAQSVLEGLGYSRLHFRVGDGTFGWAEFSPYDAIMVAAAAVSVPRHLQDQLGKSGRLIIPVGSGFQELVLIRREGQGFSRTKLLPVRFVPLISTQ